MKIGDALFAAGGNFSRPTRYTAIITLPGVVGSPDDSAMLDLLCKSVKLPDTTMEPIDIKYKGHNVKIPGRVNQEQQVDCTFYLDEDHNSHQVLTDWLQLMDRYFYDDLDDGPYYQFYGTIELIQRDFDESSARLATYNFDLAYPISVSGFEYGANSNSEIHEFTVSFAFTRYVTT